MLPPAKVLADAFVRLIVPVPVTVRFVDVAVFQAVPLPASVHVPEPEAIVRMFVFEEDTWLFTPDKVTLNPFASNVPRVIDKATEVLELPVYASNSLTVPFGESIKTATVAKVTPALVIVCVVLPEKVMFVPPFVIVVPVPLIQLP